MSCLISHGYYLRKYIDGDGRKHEVQIPRLRCRECKTHYSCLYEFLIPYRRYGVAALGAGMFTYLTVYCSYADALWCGSEHETSIVISTLWRAMCAFLQKVQLAQIELQLGLVREGKDLVQASDVMQQCPNSLRAVVKGRASSLNRASELVSLAKQFLKGEPMATLHELFLERTEMPRYLLAGRKSLDLSGPHRAQLEIF